jgi:hypothetical protein
MISQINQYGSVAIRKTGELMIAQAPQTDFPSFLKALGRRVTVLREWQLFFERYPLIRRMKIKNVTDQLERLVVGLKPVQSFRIRIFRSLAEKVQT